LKKIEFPRLHGGFYRLIYGCLFTGFIFFAACTNPDDIGLDFIDDQLGVECVDTFLIYATTVKEDSIRTDYSALNLAGFMNDPVFGKSKSGFFAQYRMNSDNIDFGESPQIDSVVLSLVYSGYYGDTLTPQTIRVMEIKDSILDRQPSVRAYYSNEYLPVYEQELGSLTFTGRPIAEDFANDTVNTTFKSWPQHLRIRLSDEFGTRILNAAEDSLSNNYNFTRFFKGLYVTMDEVPASSMGCIYYFLLTNEYSRLTVYYHNDNNSSTQSSYKVFNVKDESGHYNVFENYNLEGAHPALYQQVVEGDTAIGDSLLFISSLSRTASRIKIPYLDNIKSFGKRIAINKAQIIMYADSSFSDSDVLYPSVKVGLQIIDPETGALSNLLDEGSNALGGAYVKADNSYVLNVTRQLQEIISGGAANSDLKLVVAGSAILGTRVVIRGPGRSEKPLKLIVAYTVLEE